MSKEADSSLDNEISSGTALVPQEKGICKKLLAYIEDKESKIIIAGAVTALPANLITAVGFIANNSTTANIGRMAYILPNLIWEAEALARWKKSPGEMVAQTLSLFGFAGDALADFIHEPETEENENFRTGALFLTAVSAAVWTASACMKENQRNNKRTFLAKCLSGPATLGLLAASAFGDMGKSAIQILNASSRAVFAVTDFLWYKEGRDQQRKRSEQEEYGDLSEFEDATSPKSLIEIQKKYENHVFDDIELGQIPTDMREISVEAGIDPSFRMQNGL